MTYVIVLHTEYVYDMFIIYYAKIVKAENHMLYVRIVDRNPEHKNPHKQEFFNIN